MLSDFHSDSFPFVLFVFRISRDIFGMSYRVKYLGKILIIWAVIGSVTDFCRVPSPTYDLLPTYDQTPPAAAGHAQE